jgi:hypothetical protein
VTHASGPRWAVVGAWLARLVLAGVFLAAAAPKIADPLGFAAALANYRVFPDVALHPIATVVPALELVAALAVLTGWRLRGGLWLLGGTAAGVHGACSPRPSPAASTSTAAASAATTPRWIRSARCTSCETPACWSWSASSWWSRGAQPW